MNNQLLQTPWISPVLSWQILFLLSAGKKEYSSDISSPSNPVFVYMEAMSFSKYLYLRSKAQINNSYSSSWCYNLNIILEKQCFTFLDKVSINQSIDVVVYRLITIWPSFLNFRPRRKSSRSRGSSGSSSSRSRSRSRSRSYSSRSRSRSG